MNDVKQFIREYVEARGGKDALSEGEKKALVEMAKKKDRGTTTYRKTLTALKNVFQTANTKELAAAVRSTTKLSAHHPEVGLLELGQALTDSLK